MTDYTGCEHPKQRTALRCLACYARHLTAAGMPTEDTLAYLVGPKFVQAFREGYACYLDCGFEIENPYINLGKAEDAWAVGFHQASHEDYDGDEQYVCADLREAA